MRKMNTTKFRITEFRFKLRTIFSFCFFCYFEKLLNRIEYVYLLINWFCFVFKFICILLADINFKLQVSFVIKWPRVGTFSNNSLILLRLILFLFFFFSSGLALMAVLLSNLWWAYFFFFLEIGKILWILCSFSLSLSLWRGRIKLWNASVCTS